jgi:hypothetical protein
MKLVAAGGDYLDRINFRLIHVYRKFTRKSPERTARHTDAPCGALLAISVARMNLKMIAVMVAVLGLALMGSLGRLALPEAMWLAVWGIGLIAAGASVRSVPVQALEIARVEPKRELATASVAMGEA